MRTLIDIVWLDLGADGTGGSVLGVHEALAPRRLGRAPRAWASRTTAALELAPGDASDLGLAPGAEVDLRFTP